MDERNGYDYNHSSILQGHSMMIVLFALVIILGAFAVGLLILT